MCSESEASACVGMDDARRLVDASTRAPSSALGWQTSSPTLSRSCRPACRSVFVLRAPSVAFTRQFFSYCTTEVPACFGFVCRRPSARWCLWRSTRRRRSTRLLYSPPSRAKCARCWRTWWKRDRLPDVRYVSSSWPCLVMFLCEWYASARHALRFSGLFTAMSIFCGGADLLLLLLLPPEFFCATQRVRVCTFCCVLGRGR